MSRIDEGTLITEPTEQMLNKRQLLDYWTHRRKCLEWLLAAGKDPETTEGDAFQTVADRAYRMDVFYRWVWEQEDRYTTNVTHNHDNDWLYHSAHPDKSNAHKDNCLKALQMLSKWREYEHNFPRVNQNFHSPRKVVRQLPATTLQNPRENRFVKLHWNTVQLPDIRICHHRSAHGGEHILHNDLRNQGQQSKAEISQSDWSRKNSWKILSLIWVSLDAGLRPIEVERAVTSWVDIENSVLRIPKEEKNYDHWIVGLKDKTSDILSRWLSERNVGKKYDNINRLWLTREDTPC